MSIKNINLKDIITEQSLKNGNLILMAGRPGMNQMCFYNKLTQKKDYEWCYINLYNSTISHLSKVMVIDKFLSSVEIIKSIDEILQTNYRLKYIVIDEWKVIEDKNDWFIWKLLVLSITYKVIIFVNYTLPKQVDYRENRRPILEDFDDCANLYRIAPKVIFVNNPNIYVDSPDTMNMEYVVYKNEMD